MKHLEPLTSYSVSATTMNSFQCGKNNAMSAPIAAKIYNCFFL